MSKQTQGGGDGSVNVQAGGNVIVRQGLSYSDVRDIAHDVFEANYEKLSGEAAVEARKRFEEITEKFLVLMAEKFPEGFSQAANPDFQHSLFVVQREYARCGDPEVGDLLVQLLVDRATKEQRSLQQIVLNESLLVIPKITSEQLSILSLVFVLKYTMSSAINSHERLASFLDVNLTPYWDGLNVKGSSYQHLEYLGCGTLGMLAKGLGSIFLRDYTGLFFLGFDEHQLVSSGIHLNVGHPIFGRCLNNPAKFQFKAIRKSELELDIIKHGLVGIKDRLFSLYGAYLMNDDQVQDLVVKFLPKMAEVFKDYKLYLGAFTLTSVGVALAHANIRKHSGEIEDLSVWI